MWNLIFIRQLYHFARLYPYFLILNFCGFLGFRAFMLLIAISNRLARLEAILKRKVVIFLICRICCLIYYFLGPVGVLVGKLIPQIHLHVVSVHINERGSNVGVNLCSLWYLGLGLDVFLR